MSKIIQFGDAKERAAQKIRRLMERSGINDMLIARIIGCPAVKDDLDAMRDPNNPNNGPGQSTGET